MYFNYIKKHKFNVRNIILFIIFLLIGIALTLTISVFITFSSLKNDAIKNDIKFRTLIINGDKTKYDLITNINHIVEVEDEVFKKMQEYSVKEFDTDIKGRIVLNAYLDSNNIIINNGKNIVNKYDAICSDMFYPYEIEKIDDKIVFNRNRLLKPNDFLNKEFEITTEDNKNYKFKIVGTYNSTKNLNDLGSCYINKDIFKEIVPNSNGGNLYIDSKTGEQTFIPEELTGKIAIIDNYKNLDIVKEELSKLGFIVTPYSELNKGYVELIFYTPIIGTIIISLVFCSILESFISKKIKLNAKSNAILKATGYSKHKIKMINLMENLIIFIFSYLITIILYIIIFNYMKNYYYSAYIYDGTILSFSIIPIIITPCIFMLLIYFINEKMLNKNLDKSISEILQWSM